MARSSSFDARRQRLLVALFRQPLSIRSAHIRERLTSHTSPRKVRQEIQLSTATATLQAKPACTCNDAARNAESRAPETQFLPLHGDDGARQEQFRVENEHDNYPSGIRVDIFGGGARRLLSFDCIRRAQRCACRRGCSFSGAYFLFMLRQETMPECANECCSYRRIAMARSICATGRQSRSHMQKRVRVGKVAPATAAAQESAVVAATTRCRQNDDRIRSCAI